jgi:hypothetical protein
MPGATTPSPENVIARDDPGDETANRYRFQWTWAAVACCMLLDDTEDVEEVFCEHHEDVLLKHCDGSFTGHQVKTRGDEQPPWKASDEPVQSACGRFAKLEAEFPERFRRFCFLTNHQLHAAANGQGLAHILESISEAASVADLPANVARWLRRIARQADVSEAVAFAAMSKTIARADLPKLNDAAIRLIDTIAQCWSPAADCSHGTIRRAAQALIEECGRASSLEHIQLLPAYVIAAVGTDTEIRARIDGKRMTLERVNAVLEQGRDSTAILDGDPALAVPSGQGSTDLLHKKLDAGGFSAVSRNSAADLRDKADYLCIKWIKQHGNAKGLARYDHVHSVVFIDAGRAFDASQCGDPFGPAMREDLRGRFRDRRANGYQLFDCTDDHLEGIAFSLTAQCRIQWSHARPWESQ